MSSSSFLYSGLDNETSALALELEALGGGDASLGRLEVHVVVDERITKKEKTSDKVLWVHGKTVGIRDATLPKSTPSADAMSYVNVTSTTKLTSIVQNPSSCPLDPHGIADWVLDGFNACVISHGSRNLGKTLSFFGPNNDPVLADPVSFDSIAEQKDARNSPAISITILKRLYERTGLPLSSVSTIRPSLKEKLHNFSNNNNEIKNNLLGDEYHTGGRGTTIAISCWAVSGSNVIDLLAVPTSEQQSYILKKRSHYDINTEFSTVQCNSLDAALAILTNARAKAPGCCMRHSECISTKEVDRGHFFLRILVHQSNTCALQSSSNIDDKTPANLLSHIHIVDLLGSATPELDPQFQNLNEADKIARRDQALQLQSFTQILANIRKTALKKSESLPPSITNARDTVLTSLLAPLLQGNCRTSIVLFLKDGETNYRASKASLSVVQGLSGVLQPCHRVSAVPLSVLDLIQPNIVLPPHVPRLRHVISHDHHQQQLQQQQQQPVKLMIPEMNTVESKSLDDSVTEYGHVDLMSVAAGAADNSPKRSGPTSAAIVSNSEFNDLLIQQSSDKLEFNTASNQNTKVSNNDLTASHSYMQYVDAPPDVVDVPSLPEHQGGMHKCVFKHGAHIKDQPSVSAANVGAIEYDELAEFTSTIVWSNDKQEVAFIQLCSGGWVRYEKDGKKVLVPVNVNLLSPPRKSSSPPLTPNTSPKRKNPVLESPSKPRVPNSMLACTGNVVNKILSSTLSPVLGPTSIVSDASKHLDDHEKSLKNKVAGSYNEHRSPKRLTINSQALQASQLLLQAKEKMNNIIKSYHPSHEDSISFEEKLRNIYTKYNPSKLSEIPKLLETFKGKENMMIRQLILKYDINHEHDELQNEINSPEKNYSNNENSLKCHIVHPDGCYIRDIPSQSGGTIGQLDYGSEILSTGRIFCPPNEDNTTYIELIKSESFDTPNGGWIPIIGKLMRRIIQIPGFDYVRMVMENSSSDGDSINASSESDFSMQKNAYILDEFNSEPNSPNRQYYYNNNNKNSDELSMKFGALNLSEAGNKALEKARDTVQGTTGDEAGESVDVVNSTTNLSQSHVTFLDVSATTTTSDSPKGLGVTEMSGVSTDIGTIAEVDVLRRNTASLMESLNMERNARVDLQKKIVVAEAEADEAKSAISLIQEDFRLTEKQLNSQIKALMESKDLLPAFSIYEKHIKRVENECNDLRNRNMQLEMNHSNNNEQDHHAPPSVKGSGASYRQGSSGFISASVEIANIKSKHQSHVRQLMSDNAALSENVSTLLQQQRQYQLGLRITQDSTMKLQVAHEKIKKLESELEDTKYEMQRIQDRCDALGTESEQLMSSDQVLRDEWSNVQQELTMLRRRVSELDDERWRQAQMDLLAAPGVKSTVPDLLPTEGGSGAGADMNIMQPSYLRTTIAAEASRHPSSISFTDTSLQGAAALEAAISDLHARLLEQAPTLLPLLRHIGNCIHHERAHHMQTRVNLLNTAFPISSHKNNDVHLIAEQRLSNGALINKNTVRHVVSERRHEDVLLSTAYLNIKNNDGILVNENNNIITAGNNFFTGTKNINNFKSVSTSSTLAELRKHRKAIRDAHSKR